MANGVNPLVPKVNLKADGTVDVIVEVTEIDSGQWAEVSGYIIQESTTQGNPPQESRVFVPFSAIREVTQVDSGVPTVTVNVPVPTLNPEADLKVIARLAKAQIWPNWLRPGVPELAQNIEATWEAQPGNPAAASRSQYSGQAVPVSPATSTGTTNPGSPSQSSVTVTIPNGAKVTITW